MLKNNGHLILLAPAYQFLFCKMDKQLGHYRRYTRKSLAGILPVASFEVIQKKYFNAAGAAGWLVFGKILGNKMIGNTEMSIFDKLVPVFKLVDKVLVNQIGSSVIVAARKL